MQPPHPTARVVDAELVPDGGPALLVLSRLPRAAEIADAVASARGVSRIANGRLHVMAQPDRLVDAAGRVGGGGLAELVRGVVEPAVEAWFAPPPDLETAGAPLPTASRPVVMGVLNVTPDSFSDGGVHLAAEAAVAGGLAMVEAGADVVDVGGESTRPGAAPVPAEQELERVLPVVEALAAAGVAVSIDTTKAAVARAAVASGAVLVNDVSAGAFDPELLPAVAELGAGYVLMHMRGTPRTMQDDPTYEDVVAEVYDALADGLAVLAAAGVGRERVTIDPGIGFGKTAGHNLALLRRLRGFTCLGRPVLVGASRKSFIGTITEVADPADRLPGSLAAAAVAVASGARLVRAHDVAETVQAVRVAHAIASADDGDGIAR